MGGKGHSEQVAALQRRVAELEGRLAQTRRISWDILPPEAIIAAINYLHVKAYGPRRHEAYELSDGGSLPLPKRLLVKSDLVKHGGAFSDLVDLQKFLNKLGWRIQNGSDWRELVAWDAVFPKKREKVVGVGASKQKAGAQAGVAGASRKAPGQV